MAKYSRKIAKMSKSAFEKIVKSAIKACKYLFNALKVAWKLHKKAVAITGIVVMIAGIFIYIFVRYR